MTTSTLTPPRLREFPLPDVGEGLTEAEILHWHVAVGDRVRDGQVVCEVETAKAAVELPVPYDGVVHSLGYPEGAAVAVGAVLITVDTAPEAGEVGEVGEAAAPPESGERKAVLVGYGVAPSRTVRRTRRTTAVTAVPAAAPVPASVVRAERPTAKPPVRRLAKDLGIDLREVTPTGPDGTVTRADVQAAAAARTAPAPAPEPAAEPVPGPVPGPVPTVVAVPGETRTPVKGVRKATAEAMVRSAFTAPHVTEFLTVDVTRTMRLVAELRRDPAFEGLRVSPLLVTAKALLTAVRRNPGINAAWDEANREIVQYENVNLGVAAATPRGLLVPVVKAAQRRTLPELARSINELADTARAGRTAPEDLRGGTVTITNIGVFGVDAGTPILNPGESAILALGAVRERPWVHKGRVVARQVTTLALSFDHRVVDGELGSRFLADIGAVLERPKRLLTWS